VVPSDIVARLRGLADEIEQREERRKGLWNEYFAARLGHDIRPAAAGKMERANAALAEIAEMDGVNLLPHLKAADQLVGGRFLKGTGLIEYPGAS
jgi:hypothetical protein